MTNFKRFSREELRKYVADHKIGVNSKYVSEPHRILGTGTGKTSLAMSFTYIVKKKQK
jgi:hypothetical protein